MFFGGVSYTHNFGRSDISRLVRDGQREFIGSVKPGNVFGVNFGMGLALNERSSFSIGADLYSIGRTKQNGIAVAGSVRTQLSSLLLGYSYRYSDRTTMNLTVGAGLTRDTPDLTLTRQAADDVLRRRCHAALKSVLCLTLAGDAAGVIEQLRAGGWDAGAGERPGRGGPPAGAPAFAVGLLVVGGTMPVPRPSSKPVSRPRAGRNGWRCAKPGRWSCRAFATCCSAASTTTSWRQPTRTTWSLVLQHAAQRAMLRHRHRTQLHAGDAMGMVGRARPSAGCASRSARWPRPRRRC